MFKLIRDYGHDSARPNSQMRYYSQTSQFILDFKGSYQRVQAKKPWDAFG